MFKSNLELVATAGIFKILILGYFGKIISLHLKYKTICVVLKPTLSVEFWLNINCETFKKEIWLNLNNFASL